MYALTLTLFLCITYVYCTSLLFDGRIPKGTLPSDFDSGATPYNDRFVHGQNQTWKDIITTKDLPASLFDGTKFQALSLSLTDASIFVPNPTTIQRGFRRSELLPKSAVDLTSNVTTFHFSLMKDLRKPLNLSHEYQLVFIEPNDGTHVFEIKYGTDYSNTANPAPLDVKSANQLRLMSSSTAGWDKMKVLFQTEFTPYIFHNFAITIDWNKSTLAAYYSKGTEPLAVVVPTRANPTKPGEFHVGIVKLPVGLTKSVVFEGVQEKDLHEALIYGGIFVESSKSGFISTTPF